jgi:DNA-binding beta-propeller fold protein YncE
VIGALALFACDGSASTPATQKKSSQTKMQEVQGVTEAASPHMNIAANDPAVQAPLDATPSPDGEKVYFTALALSADSDPTPAVFGTTADGGAIETLAAEGGEPTAVSGTEGYGPHGVVIAREHGKEWVYFTGRDPESGLAGVYRTPPDGGGVETMMQDESFVDPGGVAVADSGDVYVIDGRGSQGTASLLRVHAGTATTVIDGLGVGFPAGLTLTLDGKTALISGLDPITKHDVVYFVEVATGKLSILSKPVHAFSEPAGLHRAHNADVFAWADSEANDTGTVYVLKP